MRRLSALCLLCVLPAILTLGAGCGEGGVADGATVSVYVARPLCAAAERQLRGEGEQAGKVRARIVCLPPVGRRGRNDLAVSGANARRATEDSTSIAYLEAAGPAADFSRSIVESAEIAWLESSSGSAAMRRVLHALDERGSSSPRAAVLDQVG